MNNCLKCGARCEKEYCWRCKPRKPLKRGKMGAKPSNILHNAENKHQMRDFFLGIWNKKPHYSEISNQWLGNEPKSLYFHHILEKQTVKEAMYDEENIILLTADEHTNVHLGIYRYEKINKRRELLKTKYNLI